MQQVVFALYNGFASGMSIFLVAAGVTLIFGILKIVNFAHGAFFMLGAYLAFTFLGEDIGGVPQLLAASLAAGLLVGLLGWIIDKVVFDRIRGFDEHFVLIATFALLLVVSGIVKVIWGVEYHSISPPAALAGAWRFAGVVIPTYSLFIIAVGLVTFVVLDFCLHRLWIGKILRSLVNDSWAVGLLGFNVSAFYLFTVMLAFALAGAAGALLAPNQSLSPTLAESYLLLGFVCCIIGGLGNVRGAFIASILLGTVESLTTVLLNGFPGITVYVAMVLVLLFRPQGLFGSAATGQHSSAALERWTASAPRRTDRPKTSTPASPRAPATDLRLTARSRSLIGPVIAALGLAAVASAPTWANPGLLFLMGLTAIEAVFALSWNFLFGYAGVVSFGHAAFFAIGAYCVGAGLKLAAGVPFPLLLVGAALAGALTAALVGLMALRRASGIYLAILTMSLAEILRIVVGYSTALGRDDGLAAIPRPVVDLGVTRLDLTGDSAYFYFILAVTLVVVAPLWWLAHSRYGRMLRAIHQDAERAVFVGLDVARYRLMAFMTSAAVAALIGGVSAPWTQIVTPEAANLSHSMAPVLNTLLGGASSFWGPVVGSSMFAFVGFATRTLAGISEIIIGGTLLIIVLVAPEGIVGFLRKMDSRRRVPRDAAGVDKGVKGLSQKEAC